MKKGFSKLIEKDGFYIILFICVCIVATAAVWVSKSNLNKISEQNIPTEDEFSIVKEETEDDISDEEPSLESTRIQDGTKEEDIEEMEDEEEIEEEIEEELEETTKEEPKIEPKQEQKKNPPVDNPTTMILPVQGRLGHDFTKDALVYSKTLEEWTSHDGIDIIAKEGTIVRASLGGTIREVYEDDLWGIVIIIDHGNGLQTRYCNLSNGQMVREGQKVQKGDPISGVGKSAGIEMAEEAHLHFEVLKDGKYVDPMEYLPKIQ